MGFIPDHWGPYLWGAIHIVCLGASIEMTPEEKQQYTNFFNSLPDVLPCASCGNHFQAVLDADPIEKSLDGRDSLFAWSVRVHNAVNRRLGKSEWSHDNAQELWRKVCLGDFKECNNTMRLQSFVVYIIATIIAIALGYIIYTSVFTSAGSKKKC
jgi:hypothetical protein